VLFVTKKPTSIALGWREPVSGRELRPLESSLSRRTVRQLCARVASETPNAATNRIWRPPSRELSDRGRGLMVEPLANHQRESPEQGIECGSITLMLFFLIMLLMKLSNVPDWVLPSLGLLLLLLCLLTMFFLLVQGVQAIRHRKSKTAVSSSSAEDAVYGLDYGPRNTKEK
jgi:hypothetical protein